MAKVEIGEYTVKRGRENRYGSTPFYQDYAWEVWQQINNSTKTLVAICTNEAKANLVARALAKVIDPGLGAEKRHIFQERILQETLRRVREECLANEVVPIVEKHLTSMIDEAKGGGKKLTITIE